EPEAGRAATRVVLVKTGALARTAAQPIVRNGWQCVAAAQHAQTLGSLCTVWGSSRACGALGKRACLRYTAPRGARWEWRLRPRLPCRRGKEPHDDQALHAGWLCDHAHRTPGLALCGDGPRTALYQ